jgi:transposase-like protein
MSDPQSRDDHPWRDKETLRKLYLERNLSLSDVATELDCSKHTIINGWIVSVSSENLAGGPLNTSLSRINPDFKSYTLMRSYPR